MGDSPSELRTVPPSVIRQAERIRLLGNESYKKNRFGAAIDAYTEAIALNPNVASSWTNRAQCFRKRNDWPRVEEDCRKAIKLEPSSFKGHFILGLALVERNEHAEAIKHLEKALDLGNTINPEDRTIQMIRMILSKAKYTIWEQESTVKSCKLQDLREACRTALEEQILSKCIPGINDDKRIVEETETYKRRLDFLSKVFDEVEASNNQWEVPDYLCCKISLEIYNDPVITPCGITYEKAMLLDHLRKVGPFEPTTREPLQPRQLVPNLAIKEAVWDFLNRNGWAYKSTEMPAIILE